MLVALSVTSALLLLSILYNIKLHGRLRAYEHVWEQIEQVADRNQDGTFTINIQHMDHVHGSEAHLNADQSGIHLLDLDEELSGGSNPEDNRTDGPPRAA